MSKIAGIISIVLSISLLLSLVVAQDYEYSVSDNIGDGSRIDALPEENAADKAIIYGPGTNPVDPVTPEPQLPGPAEPQAGGGGGSSSGGNTQNLADSGSCITEWVCSEWNQCVNGQQTRTCTKKALNCFADPKKKPVETQSCVNEVSPEEQKQESEAKGFFARITGAVIGTVGKAGTLGVIIFIVIIGGASYFVYSRRRAKKIQVKK
jgi:hypothetical protein